MNEKLPAFEVIAAALRITTETLAREVVDPSATAPAWSEFEWGVARAVAAMHGVTVLLANRLRWRGPEPWQKFLATQRQQALERYARIGSLLTGIDRSLEAGRISCVALKGSALRGLPLYRPGERPMGDIDLLALPADVEKVARALRTLDYGLSFETRRHQVFAPCAAQSQAHPGEHPDNPVRIEVHSRIDEKLPVHPIDITAGLMRENSGFGLADYAAPHELLRHLLLHTAGSMRSHTLRQVQLHDLALLAGRLAPSDWDHLLETPDEKGGCWWMWPVLELARRYYADSFPPVIDAFRERTPRWLRRASTRMTLSGLSWSNLRIAAFPGIHWARTPGEVLQFMRSRALPERRTLDELQTIKEIQPAMLQVPWYGISQPQRILRWVFTRPPRVQTMVCLQAALGAGKSP